MAVKIVLDEKNKLYLESDSRQWIVRKYGKPSKDSKTGEMKDSYSTIGHYGSIESVFNSLRKDKMLLSNAQSFEALISEVKEYRVEVRGLLRGLEGVGFHDDE